MSDSVPSPYLSEVVSEPRMVLLIETEPNTDDYLQVRLSRGQYKLLIKLMHFMFPRKNHVLNVHVVDEEGIELEGYEPYYD